MLPIVAVIVVPVFAKETTLPFGLIAILTLSFVKLTTGASCAPSDTPLTPPVADEGKKSEKISFGTTPSVRCVGCKTAYRIQ